MDKKKKVHPIFNNRWEPIFLFIESIIFCSIFGYIKGLLFSIIFAIVITLVKESGLMTRIVRFAKRFLFLKNKDHGKRTRYRGTMHE